jgi:hypothetical protein
VSVILWLLQDRSEVGRVLILAAHGTRDQRRRCDTALVSVARSDLQGLAERLRGAAGAISAHAAAVDAGAPWPLSATIGVEPEARWGPPEVLAHVAEMLPFWTGEMQRVLAGRGEPVPFGRVAANELRIAVVERDRTLPSRELFDRIAAGADRLAARLGELPAGDAERRGVHETLGEMTVVTLVDRFVVGHLEEHVEQLKGALSAR